MAEVNLVVSVYSGAQCRQTAGVDRKIIDAIDHFEERAAICESDGCQPRSKAEVDALIEAARTAGVEVIDLRAALISKKNV